jgi:hypothetical protein
MVQDHHRDYSFQTAVAQAVVKQQWLGRETRCAAGSCMPRSMMVAGRVTSAEQAEIKRLNGENRWLRGDVDILRAASDFFPSA